MKSLLLFAILCSPSLLQGQQSALPKGVTIWPKGTPPAGIKHKDDYGSHILSISHRENDGVVELHEHKDDVFVIQSGEGTLVVGGRGVNMHPSAPGEQQGTSIQGGTSMHVAAGDVIHIPANIPHQFFITAGTEITYLVVKVLVP